MRKHNLLSIVFGAIGTISLALPFGIQGYKDYKNNQNPAYTALYQEWENEHDKQEKDPKLIESRKITLKVWNMPKNELLKIIENNQDSIDKYRNAERLLKSHYDKEEEIGNKIRAISHHSGKDIYIILGLLTLSTLSYFASLSTYILGQQSTDKKK